VIANQGLFMRSKDGKKKKKINTIYHINTMKDKNAMIISTDTKKKNT
jgi:hypothetical protein